MSELGFDFFLSEKTSDFSNEKSYDSVQIMLHISVNASPQSVPSVRTRIWVCPARANLRTFQMKSPMTSFKSLFVRKAKKEEPRFAWFFFFLVAELGFEPRQTESESAVLPLHNSAKKWCERRELNPYDEITRPLNVRVCQFRHSRIYIMYSAEHVSYYSKSFSVCQDFFLIFLNFFSKAQFFAN